MPPAVRGAYLESDEAELARLLEVMPLDLFPPGRATHRAQC
jgi:hypothetical protein